MWRPPQRIKHVLPAGDWPTAAQAHSARWFQPISLGPLALRHRTWIPAMVPWRATDDGHVTQDVLDWYGRFAEGQPGAIVVEATGIRDIPSGPLLRIGHPRFTPGLRELVEVVRQRSGGKTRLLIQLIDFLRIRRRPDPQKFFARFLSLTREHLTVLGVDSEAEARGRLTQMPLEEARKVLSPREREALDYGARERVTDVEHPHIEELPRVLPDLFADAAGRALEAGFDGVELHYAHAYTMASFLSALNTRTDGYGGPLEQRLRLPLEVYAAVRARVGDAIAVGCRFLARDVVEGGNELDDARRIAVAFSDAGMDFLSLSRGGKFEDAKQPKVGWTAYPYTGPSGYECMPTVLSDARGPFGRNVEAASSIRGAVRAAGFETPIVVAGGICSFGQAEQLLTDGEADIVGAARQSLADPDWFRKTFEGRGDTVRRCKFTNYCEALDQKHEKVTCQLWDRKRLDEPDVPLTADGRRRLIAPRD